MWDLYRKKIPGETENCLKWFLRKEFLCIGPCALKNRQFLLILAAVWFLRNKLFCIDPRDLSDKLLGNDIGIIPTNLVHVGIGGEVGVQEFCER